MPKLDYAQRKRCHTAEKVSGLFFWFSWSPARAKRRVQAQTSGNRLGPIGVAMRAVANDAAPHGRQLLVALRSP